jgi:hypothetical protein
VSPTSREPKKLQKNQDVATKTNTQADTVAPGLLIISTVWGAACNTVIECHPPPVCRLLCFSFWTARSIGRGQLVRDRWIARNAAGWGWLECCRPRRRAQGAAATETRPEDCDSPAGGIKREAARHGVAWCEMPADDSWCGPSNDYGFLSGRGLVCKWSQG